MESDCNCPMKNKVPSKRKVKAMGVFDITKRQD